jgi:hypothetical protein
MFKLARRPKVFSRGFFADTLPKTDVIVMGHILHDWDLGQKKALLGKAFEALPKGGVVIAYDPIIDDDREAGFSATRVEHLVGPHSMAIGIK